MHLVGFIIRIYIYIYVCVCVWGGGLEFDTILKIHTT